MDREGVREEDASALRQRRSGVSGSFGASESEEATMAASGSPPCFNYGTADAYAQAVRAWIFAYQAWSFGQQMAPLYAQQQLLLQQQQQQQMHAAQPAATPTNAAQRTPIQGGSLFLIASFSVSIIRNITLSLFPPQSEQNYLFN